VTSESDRDSESESDSAGGSEPQAIRPQSIRRSGRRLSAKIPSQLQLKAAGPAGAGFKFQVPGRRGFKSRRRRRLSFSLACPGPGRALPRCRRVPPRPGSLTVVPSVLRASDPGTDPPDAAAAAAPSQHTGGVRIP
jgi:hypothetical protein